MANLTLIEKSNLEELFSMDSGYVLDFTNPTFAIFFEGQNIRIGDSKYTVNKVSESKANRLRGFWEQESDVIVGRVLQELIKYAEHLIERNHNGLAEKDKKLIADCRNISGRLTGEMETENTSTSENAFLAFDFGRINLEKLPVESQLLPILQSRINEAQKCLENNANLSAIIMAGSILEGLLLGAAQKYPNRFNESHSCPKDSAGKPKKFNDWTLSEFINVGSNINILGNDVAKFSHGLREFRNYIHPYEQMVGKFSPDGDTAKICMQVLKAAISDLEKNRLIK